MHATDAPVNGWTPVFWEPVAHTTERLMVGVLVRIGNSITAHRVIRDDLLQCLYGKASIGAVNLIDFYLNDLRIMAEHRGMEALSLAESGGLTTGNFSATGQDNISDALRTAALMFSSLAALDKFDELDAEDTPQPEEVSRQFATEVRVYVTERRPNLAQYFNRKASLIQGGQPVKFGLCTPRAVMHFGTLHPVRQAAGVRDARARLWELHRVREYAQINMAALIIAAPRTDDATLSSKQRDAVIENLREIESEADSYDMRLFPVATAAQGGDLVIQYA